MSALKVTQEMVKKVFDYDPETGVATWLVDREKASAGEPIDHRFIYNDGYIVISLGGRSIPLHRLIYVWMTGEMPTMTVKHINGDKLDNRWENLMLRGRRGFNGGSKATYRFNSPVPLASYASSDEQLTNQFVISASDMEKITESLNEASAMLSHVAHMLKTGVSTPIQVNTAPSDPVLDELITGTVSATPQVDEQVDEQLAKLSTEWEE